MPKAKTRKIILKRFKFTKTGKILKKRGGLSHLNSTNDASIRSRRKGLTQVSKGHAKNIRKMIVK